MATRDIKEPAATDQVKQQVTEPAAPVQTTVTEPAGRARVEVYDKTTGKKLLHKVPRTWLDGRFPNLTETPSSKQKEGN